MRDGEANINEPLVGGEKIIIPPLKIIIQTWFDEAVCESLACNWELLQLYLRNISYCDHRKTESRHFWRPSNPQTHKRCVFSAVYDRHRAACQSFVLVTQHFVGNRKAENYRELVEGMLYKFKDLDVKMSIMVHYLFSEKWSPSKLIAHSCSTAPLHLQHSHFML